MKAFKITEDGVEFDNGIIIRHRHEQDCCENVYADWESLKTTSFADGDFPPMDIDKHIEYVVGAGIRLFGFFVPCYNEQNGYYDDELELVISREMEGNPTMTIDITNCAKDCIG